jgi:integrase/recombinase XerC
LAGGVANLGDQGPRTNREIQASLDSEQSASKLEPSDSAEGQFFEIKGTKSENKNKGLKTNRKIRAPSEVLVFETNCMKAATPVNSGDIPGRKLRLVHFKMVKQDYLLEVKTTRTHATVKTYQSMLNRYERHLAVQGQPDPDVEFALDLSTLNGYKYSLLSKGVKKDGPLLGQSVRAVMGPLKGLCTYLIRIQLLPPDGNPFKNLSLPPKVDPVRLRVSDEEVLALMEATERHSEPRKIALSRFVLSTLIHAGVRADEFQNIEIGHLNVQQETLEVRRGKGGKTRLLHPPKEFWVAYRGWKPFRDALNCQHPYVFALGPKMRMNDDSLRKHLEELKAIAGLKGHDNIHPHRLRGWFATHMHENGASIPSLQEALGHSHPQTTFVYLNSNGKGATAMKTCASFGPVGWGGATEMASPVSRKAAAPVAETKKDRQRSPIRHRRTSGR